MGARLSLLAPLSPTVATLSYIDIIDDLNYRETINNSRFLKTVRATDSANREQTVVKIFIKPDLGILPSLLEITKLITREARQLAHFPHCLPWNRLFETDHAGYLQRRWLGINLYDRLSLRPFFDPIERLFIVYQMLIIVRDLHQQLQIHHGDLKLENFICTLWNWVILTDFAAYTKPTFLPADNPNQFSFYFDTSDRRLGYVAPERFYPEGANIPKSNIDDEGNYLGHDALTDAMDLFSLGCCIAELYLEGEPPFTLSQLFKYLKGEFKPDLPTLSEVPYLKDIVGQLLDLDSNARPAAADILEDYRGKLFPESFEFAYSFIRQISEEPDSDTRIEMIFNKFSVILELLQVEPVFKADVKFSSITKFSLVPHRLFFPGMPHSYTVTPGHGGGDQMALLYLDLVFSAIKLVKYVGNITKACELVLALLEYVSDDNKLDRCLPYLCVVLDEYNSMGGGDSYPAVCCALSCIALLLILCQYINPLNVGVFPEYLLPKILQLSTVANGNQDEVQREALMIALGAVVPHLANVARRFWTMAKPFQLKEYDRIAFDHAPPNDPLIIRKDQLDDQFEAITFTLLTDSNVAVKLALVANLIPLCQYFGIDKTTDVILPHLITYLNHTLFELKLGFIDLVAAITPSFGVLTFEQYVLPLLFQTLGNSEPLVVLKVLQLFNQVVKTKLINPLTEFNALDVYKDLLTHLLPLLLHPIEWIRQLVLCLVVLIGENLTDADKYTFLYPIIKPFLRFDVLELTWDLLYPFLATPLLRKVYEAALQWLTEATSKLLFWLKHAPAVNVQALGKLVYLPRTHHSTSKIPPAVSPEDKHWIYKLRLLGFDDKRDMWKIVALRDYIWAQARNRTKLVVNGDVIPGDVPPLNIFFDIEYSSEPLAEPRPGVTHVSEEQDIDAVSIVDGTSNGLSLQFLNRGKALLQTSEANVYGELGTGNSGLIIEHDESRSIPTMHQVIRVTPDQVITAKVKHLYQGKNPYITKYLKLLEFVPDISNFPEFGETVSDPQKSLGLAWTPRQQIIARIGSLGTEVDGYTCIEVCPLHEFFVTGSESGVIKVWDANKLEKLIANTKGSMIEISLGTRIQKISFLPHRFALAVATSDGMLRVLKVGVVRGKNKRVLKFSAITEIRRLSVGAVVIDFAFFNRDHALQLLAVTATSKIVVIDVCHMEKRFEWNCHPQWGLPTSLCVGDDSWALVTTAHGKVILWDIRFGIQIKVFNLKRASQETRPVSISHSQLISDGPALLSLAGARVVMVVNEDTTVWEIPLFECKQVFGPKVPWDRRYTLNEIGGDVLKLDIEALFNQLLPLDPPHATVLKVADPHHVMVLVGKAIFEWNTSAPDELAIVNGVAKSSPQEKAGHLLVKEYELKLSTPVQAPRDVVTGVVVSTVPYPMVIAVDRAGEIQIYR